METVGSQNQISWQDTAGARSAFTCLKNNFGEKTMQQNHNLLLYHAILHDVISTISESWDE